MHVKIAAVTTTVPRSLPLVALVLAAAVLVINAPVIAGGKTWSDVRYHTQIAPARIAAADAVQHGELPAWWEGTGLGVPLAAEPSHGALYPPTWAAASSRSLDLILILHLAWAALGIALWARRKNASEPAAVVVALLAVASGLFVSLAMRGALPAIAMLPWIGLAASALAHHANGFSARDGSTSRDESTSRATWLDPQVRATIGLALAIGFVGLTGQLAVLVDGIAIAAVIAARRNTLARLAIAVGAGLAIASIQWIPAALFIGSGAGDIVHGMPPSRFLELVIPGSFGGDEPRAVAALAGDHPWAPSLFVGAALFAIAAVRTPARRVLGLVGALVVLVLVAGRGGWPAWLGAPELHLAALVVVLAVEGAHGLDDLLAGKRRAILALGAGAGCVAIAIGAFVVLEMRQPSPAIHRAIVDGAISAACLAIALVLAWKQIAKPAVLAFLLLSSVSAVPSTAPAIDRDVVTTRPAFAPIPTGVAPTRIFRPVIMATAPGAQRIAAASRIDLSLDEAIATLVGSSASLWGLSAARSEDPARLPTHDATWLAAAREGGALLDRFGIELAILPESVVAARKLPKLATRAKWTLVKLPVAPPAAVLRGTLWSTDPSNTLELMYPTGGGTGVLRGTIVLDGRGPPPAIDKGPPLPCTIERWDFGAIDVTCTTDSTGYAAVSSTSADGWTVTIDGTDAEWLTADMLRRAVRIEAGTHRISWRYTTPGLKLGGLLAAIALLGLIAFALANRRARRS